MHIEQEKLSKQLSELKTQKNDLEKIIINSSTAIGIGSLIETNKGLFFIAVSIGKIIIEAKEIIVISTQSPLGVKFLNLKEKDFELNGKDYLIKSIS